MEADLAGVRKERHQCGGRDALSHRQPQSLIREGQVRAYLIHLPVAFRQEFTIYQKSKAFI